MYLEFKISCVKIYIHRVPTLWKSANSQQIPNFSYPHPQPFPNQSYMHPDFSEAKFSTFPLFAKCSNYFASHFADTIITNSKSIPGWDWHKLFSQTGMGIRYLKMFFLFGIAYIILLTVNYVNLRGRRRL